MSEENDFNDTILPELDRIREVASNSSPEPENLAQNETAGGEWAVHQMDGWEIRYGSELIVSGQFRGEATRREYQTICDAHNASLAQLQQRLATAEATMRTAFAALSLDSSRQDFIPAKEEALNALRAALALTSQQESAPAAEQEEQWEMNNGVYERILGDPALSPAQATD